MLVRALGKQSLGIVLAPALQLFGREKDAIGNIRALMDATNNLNAGPPIVGVPWVDNMVREGQSKAPKDRGRGGIHRNVLPYTMRYLYS